MNEHGTWNVWDEEAESGEETGENAIVDAFETEDEETSSEEEMPGNVVALRPADEPDVNGEAAGSDAGLYETYEEPQAPASFEMPEDGDGFEPVKPVEEVRRLDVRKLTVIVVALTVIVAAGVAVAGSQTGENGQQTEKREPRTRVPNAQELAERDEEGEKRASAVESEQGAERGGSQPVHTELPPTVPPSGYPTPEDREVQRRVEASRAERAKAMGSSIAFRRQSPGTTRSQQNANGLPQSAAQPSMGPAGLTFAGRGEQQAQDPKLAFFNDQRARDTQSPHSVKAPSSPYVVMEGTVLDMVLETAVDSQNPGMVKARLLRAVFDTPTGQYLLVPAGTIVVGEYNSKTQRGQTRAQIAWRRMILPGGDNIQIPGAVGIGADGSSGVAGEVDRHLDEVAIAAVVSTTLTAGAASVSNTPARQSGPADWAAQGAGQAVSEVGERLVGQASEIPPTIRIEPGTRVMAFIRSDLIFDGPR